MGQVSVRSRKEANTFFGDTMFFDKYGLQIRPLPFVSNTMFGA